MRRVVAGAYPVDRGSFPASAETAATVAGLLRDRHPLPAAGP